MALIECAECKKEVSNKAASCPHCGAPIATASEARAAGAKLTTTQGTSKKLKLQTLLSGLIFWLGVIWAVTIYTVAEPENYSDGTPGVVIAIVAFIWYLVTRVRIWWHHD